MTRININPAGATLTGNVTYADDGSSVSLFSDSARTQALSQPVTISPSTATDFYFAPTTDGRPVTISFTSSTGSQAITVTRSYSLRDTANYIADTTTSGLNVPYTTPLAGGSATLWAANTAYVAGVAVTTPLGLVSIRAAGAPANSRAQWDATESGYWTPLGFSASYLEGVSAQFRGHSFTLQPPVRAQSGGDVQTRLSRRLNLGSVATYGKGSSRLLELLWDALDTAVSTAVSISGSLMAANLPGLVVFDGPANDVFNWTGAACSPASPTATRLTNLTSTVTALLALASASSRVEVETGTKTGVWTNTTATDPWSARTVNFTTAQNAKYDVPVTFNASGKAYAIGYDLASTSGGPTGAGIVQVDGVTQATLSAGSNWESIKSARSSGTTYGYGPWCVPLTASAGAHTVTFQKTDATAQPFYADCVLVQAVNPPLVLIANDPTPAGPGSAGFLTSQNVTDCATVRPSFTTALQNAVTNFANAHIVDLASLSSFTYLSSLDGVHPNDAGMKAYCDLLVAALANYVYAYSQGIHQL